MYPQAYLDYLVYFHCYRDYFECHEVLEEYWKNFPKNEREHHWVGLIQIAVCLYHYRRKNYSGASKMVKSAKKIVENEQQQVDAIGIDAAKLLQQLNELAKKIEREEPFNDMNLPLKEEALIQKCKQLCNNKKITWQAKSNMEDEALIHKHLTQEREQVVKERERQLQLRREQRKNYK